MEHVHTKKKWKNTSCSGVYKTRYHNGSYLLLPGKGNYKGLKFHINIFSYFEIRITLL